MPNQNIAIKSSSNVKLVSYDSESEVLTVEFASGGSYAYSGVPEIVANGFSDAVSPGQYLHSVIKPTYKATKL